MNNYHAEVINFSLKNKKMIYKYPILNVRKRFLGSVKQRVNKLLIPFIAGIIFLAPIQTLSAKNILNNRMAES